MNPIVFAMRRPFTSVFLIIAVVGGGLYGLDKMGVHIITAKKTPKIYAYLEYVGKHASHLKETVGSKVDSYFHKKEEERHEEHHKVVVTSPKAKDMTITLNYVCQIHSQQHIPVQAFENGYLGEISVKEGQSVKKGQSMFKIVPTLYQARLAAELAEAQVAEYEYINTKRLYENKKAQVVSVSEVNIYHSKLLRAQAKAALAQAELDFTDVKAPFDGIVDRLEEQLGSFIKEGDILTTLSDNSVMWVYFNVPEKRYLEYMSEVDQNRDSPDIELVLANHKKFKYTGTFDPKRRQIGAIEANFNNETGNIKFRADFPNPERLLRHGQTGTVLINRSLKNAIVIPQRATYENLAKRYVYVVGKDDVVHQREIEVAYELDDIYVIDSGVDVKDKIILEGIRQVRDGDHVEYQFRDPDDVMKDQKNKAE